MFLLLHTNVSGCNAVKCQTFYVESLIQLFIKESQEIEVNVSLHVLFSLAYLYQLFYHW